jgi:hypothetical protein
VSWSSDIPLRKTNIDKKKNVEGYRDLESFVSITVGSHVAQQCSLEATDLKSCRSSLVGRFPSSAWTLTFERGNCATNPEGGKEHQSDTVRMQVGKTMVSEKTIGHAASSARLARVAFNCDEYLVI